MTKKNVLIISSFLAVMLFVIEAKMRSINLILCSDSYYRCIDLVGNIWVAALIIIPVVPFSIITYFLREEVFRAWLRFTYWWTPLSFIIVLFSGDSHPGNTLGISGQAFFGILTWGLYIIISIAIIGWRHFATRHK